ncbi:UDP-N-acetylmuramate--L-alanine ligase [Pseudotenacibaculum sp. MALMAid0570]|uniref:UDP-N-acetylmuramate--L-alanine ligase n=1 Tax=Pseudotenacibaculum sp. MALMAid0570 TaxID=3143938 RepID=UPI0032DF524E
MNLKQVHNVYFVGIGGIGMSALARYFYAIGKKVSGYDKVSTKITDQLKANGASIHFVDDVNLIEVDFKQKTNTLVVYTPAIPDNHKELNYFKDEGFTILKRAEVLGMITEDSFCFAVAGTHGKTTTSSILGHILQPYNATSFLGGISENYKSNLILGGDKLSVVEADEFDRSFLKLSPNIACITSTDADHLDIYGNHEELQGSFKDFADKVSSKLLVAKGIDIDGITYAVEEKADYEIQNVTIRNGNYVFDVKTTKEVLKNVEFSLPGKHNLMNALAALAMADSYEIPLEEIKKSLKTYKGVERRFSYKIKTDELVLIDDYAHHPTEINAVYEAIDEMYPKEKNMVVFQPHLFSRTKDFAEGFAMSLAKFDKVLLLDVYPARELPIDGVNSQWLLEKIRNENKKLTSRGNLVEEIKKSEAKVVAMLGAGDIGVMIEEVTNQLNSTEKV